MQAINSLSKSSCSLLAVLPTSVRVFALQLKSTILSRKSLKRNTARQLRMLAMKVVLLQTLAILMKDLTY